MSDRDLKLFFDSLGLDTEDPELAETPRRFRSLLEDMFGGVNSAAPTMSTFDSESKGEPVILTNIQFQSMCVHHIVPFFGTFDIAYIPREKMAGFGSFARIVEYWSRRPQLQERLVQQVCDHLVEELNPEGVIVRCRARQMCVELRQKKSPAAYVSISSAGVLVDGPHRNSVLSEFVSSDGPL